MKYESALSVRTNEGIEPSYMPAVSLRSYSNDCAIHERPHAAIAVPPVSIHSPRQNRLLAALPASVYDRLLPHLELTALPFDSTLFRPGRQVTHAYFPTTCIVSRRYMMENGSAVTFAMIGNEGLVGIPQLMGGDATPFQMVVQRAGHAYRIRSETLKSEFECGGPLHFLLLRYMQALSTQMGQGAVCNGQHSIEQRLCRWILLSLDRMSSNSLCVTQQQIAEILGVRRESVTEAEKRLQDAGVIRCQRGQITVLNRAELEVRVCECYEVESGEFERLLPEQVAV
jgi:CRP-like cAMP-binding protein